MWEKFQVIDKSGEMARTFLFRVVGGLLHPLFRLVYDRRKRKLLQARKETQWLKVISIGNISLGGSGKTPATAFLFQRLLSRGLMGGVVMKKGRRMSHFLDEFIIYLNILRTLSGSDDLEVELGEEGIIATSDIGFVAAYRNKLEGIKQVEKAGKFQFVLLDDGFQLFSLKPHLNICLVTERDFSQVTFPKGLLREDISAISRADLVLYRDEALAERLRQVASNIPAYRFKLQPLGLFPIKELLRIWIIDKEALYDEQEPAYASLPTGTACAFSAIAYPKGFEEALLAIHTDTSFAVRFRDHHNLSLGELSFLLKNSKLHGCKFFVTTEKDACRLLPDMLMARAAEGMKVKFPELLMPKVTLSTPERTLRINELAEKCFYLRLQVFLPPEVLELVEKIVRE